MGYSVMFPVPPLSDRSESATSSGKRHCNKLVIIVLMHTLFPDPVAPAIRRCGISFRFAITLRPEMSFPTAKLIFDAAFQKFIGINQFQNETISGFSFSRQFPHCFSRIECSIRMLFARRFKAISSASFVMLLTFTTAGCTSYRVTDDPWVTFSTLASVKILQMYFPAKPPSAEADVHSSASCFAFGFFIKSTGGNT